jgi:hypothetical protein
VFALVELFMAPLCELGPDNACHRDMNGIGQYGCARFRGDQLVTTFQMLITGQAQDAPNARALVDRSTQPVPKAMPARLFHHLKRLGGVHRITPKNE